MKILKREIAGTRGSKKERTMFATSREELEILSGIAEKAIAVFPDVEATQKTHQRLRNMVRNFKRALSNWDSIIEIPSTDTYQDAINIVSREIDAITRLSIGLNVVEEAKREKEAFVEVFVLLTKYKDDNKKIKGEI